MVVSQGVVLHSLLDDSRTKLSEFSISDQESSQGLQSLDGLLSILLSRVLGHRHTRLLCIFCGDVLSLPEEFLKQLAVVLAQHELLGVVDNITEILDKALSLSGEFFRRGRESLVLERGVQGNVTLLVL